MTPADLLAFEQQWPSHTPDKTHAIRGLGMTPARFYQLLGRAASRTANDSGDTPGDDPGVVFL